MTYPKFQAPLNWTVYDMANARADRWRKRTLKAREERDALQAKLDAANEKLKKLGKLDEDAAK